MSEIGYARVSTRDQNLDLQMTALKESGCRTIYKDVASGSKASRPGLDLMRSYLREGDTVVVWKIDRIGRSLKDLITLINDFQDKNIHFKSLNDPIDTSTPQGRMMFGIFASLAQFERELIRERTMAGLNVARARGRLGGRPKGLPKSAQQKAYIAEALYNERHLSIKDICKELSIARNTLYRYLRWRGVVIGKVVSSRSPFVEVS